MDVHGVPIINPLAFSEQERDDADNVVRQLAILAYLEDQVWQALGLFNYTGEYIEALKARRPSTCRAGGEGPLVSHGRYLCCSHDLQLQGRASRGA